VAHYLDHAATTPMRPDAVAAMLPLLSDGFGNPSGAHRLARAARQVLDEAREVVAEALCCRPGEIVFTSGGTEADNLAVRGVVDARGGIAVCSAVEHHAVLDPVVHLGGVVAPVGRDGRIDLDALAEVLDSDVTLVSVMAANNETGIVQPLAEVADLVRRRAPQAVLHTDAVQGFCWLDLAELAPLVDLLTISAHKFGGPKGVGALMVRDGVELAPLVLGGGQERGRRSGTQNVAGIAALAAAASSARRERVAESARLGARRDRLVDGIAAAVDGVLETGVVGGDRRHKLPNIAHLCFEGVESEALIFLLEKEEVFVSAASSCASGALDPSHVLTAMGHDRALAFGSLRLSLGRTTTDADIDAALAAVPPAVERLRARPSW
jgi:cysteine desulfurase